MSVKRILVGLVIIFPLIQVSVLGVEPVPVADANGPYTGYVNNPVTLDGSGSYHNNPALSIISYEWDIDGDGQYDDATGATPQWTWTTAGAHVIGLRVTDEQGETATDSASVTIYNLLPVADANGPYTGYVNNPVTLDGTGSYDPAGSIVAWEWDIDGDGQYDDASGETVQWTWTTAGAHVIGLRVTEESGLTDTDSASVTIHDTAINLEKYTNGEDADTAPGPIIPIGDTVTWVFVVTNDGNEDLYNVQVIDPDVLTFPEDIGNLAAGDSYTFSVNGVATAGQYQNLAEAVGNDAAGNSVSDSDYSHYFGVIDGPAIDVEKSTQGFDADSPPGPTIPVGGDVIFQFIVTNTGNVNLTDIYLYDEKIASPYLYWLAELEPGKNLTFTVHYHGYATAGQYENEAIANATAPDGSVVEDRDLSHYFGGDPGTPPTIPILPTAAIPVAFTAVTILAVRRKKS